MPVLLPQGVPGCHLQVDPLLLELRLVQQNAAESALQIPCLPALVGFRVFHQVLPVELDALHQITAVTASNALELTVGSF